jgi:sodium/potassium-transporting ATPase subunit alpha
MSKEFVDVEALEPRVQIVLDERPAREHRETLRRRSSSLSGRHVVNSELMLPVMYRTLSINIDENATSKPVKADVDGFPVPEWHTSTCDEVCGELQTSFDLGLTEVQAHDNLVKYGPNKHSKPPSRLLQKIFWYCFGGFGSLLFVGGVLCIISWKPLGQPPVIANLALGVVLLIVFLVQAAFNCWQDWSSSRVMESISDMLPDDCIVKRSGSFKTVEAAALVPGDIIQITSGGKVPADIRIFQSSQDLKFDRSVLTGESKPVQGTPDECSPGANYLDAGCIALQGSYCCSGSGYGIIVSTGDDTVFGHIAKMTSAPSTGMSPLQKEILRFVIIVVSIIVTIVIVTIIFWAAWLRKAHPEWITVPNLIVDCVSIAVAFIPEGLPIALTTCLTIIAAAMRKNQVLCKSLSVVETLGSVSVICSDKTGTLTKNKMFATNVTVGDEVYDVDKFGNKQPSRECLLQLQAASVLCNAAKFVDAEIIGNATDQAVLRFGDSIEPVAEFIKRWNKVYELDFNSKNKFMASVLEAAVDGYDEYFKDLGYDHSSD